MAKELPGELETLVDGRIGQALALEVLAETLRLGPADRPDRPAGAEVGFEAPGDLAPHDERGGLGLGPGGLEGVDQGGDGGPVPLGDQTRGGQLAGQGVGQLHDPPGGLGRKGLAQPAGLEDGFDEELDRIGRVLGRLAQPHRPPASLHVGKDDPLRPAGVSNHAGHGWICPWSGGVCPSPS
ncbi:MAG: hypothetical protein JW809_10315 [Pirellulales bacterium]|nr:hypothetical protein [Pirellulales bacterium]